ncbi:hypothetical protein E2C01_079519 [Portunus trituberculatus]|uniref:Uncharacterized protein n=1 Tax=Portunus trituberculatus TaxID=210409 RepID=A0A5B7IJS2_PORTR|nr:hypothetical protein [Portunus trituberculatus]
MAPRPLYQSSGRLVARRSATSPSRKHHKSCASKCCTSFVTTSLRARRRLHQGSITSPALPVRPLLCCEGEPDSGGRTSYNCKAAGGEARHYLPPPPPAPLPPALTHALNGKYRSLFAF